MADTADEHGCPRDYRDPEMDARDRAIAEFEESAAALWNQADALRSRSLRLAKMGRLLTQERESERENWQ